MVNISIHWVNDTKHCGRFLFKKESKSFVDKQRDKEHSPCFMIDKNVLFCISGLSEFRWNLLETDV